MVKVHSGKFTKRCLSVIFTLVVCALLSVVAATAPAPIVSNDFFTSDPAAHVINGQVYLYTTHDPITVTNTKTVGNYEGMYDYHCLTTTNFVDWVDHGSYLNVDDIPANEKETYCWTHGAWDGDAGVYANGKYYTYFTIGDQIYVAQSGTPDGYYSDAKGAALITRNTPNMPPYDANALLVSACVLQDNGSYYLFWGQRHLYCARLKSNMIELDENPHVIDISGCNFVEDVWITKINNTYYWTYADGFGPCQIRYATSTNLYGPYTERGIFITGGSGTIQSTIINYNSNWYVFYHDGNADGQHRKACVAQMYINADELSSKSIWLLTRASGRQIKLLLWMPLQVRDKLTSIVAPITLQLLWIMEYIGALYVIMADG